MIELAVTIMAFVVVALAIVIFLSMRSTASDADLEKLKQKIDSLSMDEKRALLATIRSNGILSDCEAAFLFTIDYGIEFLSPAEFDECKKKVSAQTNNDPKQVAKWMLGIIRKLEKKKEVLKLAPPPGAGAASASAQPGMTGGGRKLKKKSKTKTKAKSSKPKTKKSAKTTKPTKKKRSS